MAYDDLIYELEERMNTAEKRYGDFSSTHEAMGVALEEWDEFRQSVWSNDLGSIEHEALDLAAVLLRLARALRNDPILMQRSKK